MTTLGDGGLGKRSPAGAADRQGRGRCKLQALQPLARTPGCSTGLPPASVELSWWSAAALHRHCALKVSPGARPLAPRCAGGAQLQIWAELLKSLEGELIAQRAQAGIVPGRQRGAAAPPSSMSTSPYSCPSNTVVPPW